MAVPHGLRVLDDAQCERIHLASLEILSRTGVRFFDPDAVERLHGHGAEIRDRNIVRFPASLVEWAIEAAPPRVVLHERGGTPAVRLEGRNVHFGTGSDCPKILDGRSGERRPFLIRDIEDGIRLCDALPGIDFVLSIGLASDVPVETSDVHQYRAMVGNTTKPIVFTAHSLQNCRTIVEMASAVAGGSDALRIAPTVAHFAEVDCPLKFAAETSRKLVFMAERGLPVIQGAGPMMGATGPQTHAGVLAQANAEQLAGAVLLQVTRRGTPFISGIGAHPFDMRSGMLPYGAPELSLNTAAAADLAHYYRVPTWGYAGCSDAKTVDQQAAVETTQSVLMSLWSGANLVHDVGYLESGLTSSFEMIVLADEVIAAGRALVKGVDITDEALALDVIDRVGHDGNYLEDEHTLRHHREIWYPSLLDRSGVDAWEAAGRPTLGDRLARRVARILDEHRVSELPDDVRGALDALVDAADVRAPEAAGITG